MYKFTQAVLDRLHIPQVHIKAVLDKIPGNPKHKKTLESYVNNIKKNVDKGQGLFLHGEYSRGKSALAAICLKAAYGQCGYIGLWIKAGDIPNYIINEIQFDSEETYYERCLSVPLLVIDEFKLRKDIKFTENSVEDLVRARIDLQKSTIITTNVSLKQLEEEYPAFHVVLQEGLYPIKIQGHDFRKGIGGKL